ncbi:MAG: glycosyltransferase [Deltaproteobacteria bacterium]|nr:glycosyltransferase [Deltaproteobacteria bacterium]
MQRLGWHVTALSMLPNYTKPNDRVGPGNPSFECLRTHAGVPGAWMPAGSIAERAVRRVARATSFPDEHVGWLPFALAAARGRRCDVVVATVPWFSTALVGLALAAQTGAQLALDYRDPWSDLLVLESPRAHWRHRAHAALEGAILDRAALVTAVTPTLATWLARRIGRAVPVLPNAIDELPPPRAVRATGTLHIVHAGSLAYGRSLKPLLAAMAVARHATQRPIRLTHAGPHGAAVAADASACGVADLVDIVGEIDQAVAEAMVHDADLAVASVSEPYAYATPGKLFQIAGRTPLLLIGPLHGDAACLVRRHVLGWTRDATDVQGMVEVLAAAERGDWPSPMGLDELTYAAVASHYDAMLRAIL